MKLYGNVRDPECLFRFIGDVIARSLFLTNITANQVSSFRFMLMIPVCYLYLFQGTVSLFVAALIYELSILLDFTDGALARMKNASSRIGIMMGAVLDPLIMNVSGLFGFCVVMGTYLRTGNPQVFIAALVYAFLMINRSAMKAETGGDHKVSDSVQDEIDQKVQEVHNNYCVRHKDALRPGPHGAFYNLFVVAFWWHEQCIVWASLFFYPLSFLPIDPILLSLYAIVLIALSAFVYTFYSRIRSQL